MITRARDPLITWLPWSGDAFERAAREGKPVLLSITAAWCEACHEMDRTTYADDRVAALVRDRFVAIRVDTDRRPDINERYNLGGWPTTAFLTSSGDVLGGGTFVDVDRMAGVLRQVLDALDSRAGELAPARVPDETGSAIARPEAEPAPDELLDAVFASFDDEYGGFGIEPKFPLTMPLHLALALGRDQPEGPWDGIVTRTLDALRDGGLHDAKQGGFFRYATTRDWQLPHVEKLLETNASLLKLYAEAAHALGNAAYRDMSVELARYLGQRLRADAGGFCGSEADTIVYTDASAAASGALLTASAVLEDIEIGRDALQQLERVLLASYRPGGGVAHYLDGGPHVRGLLVDQVAMMHALLDAESAEAGEPYGMMAEELAHYVVRTMWDEADGGFFDRAHDTAEVGLLRERRKPFTMNADAARALGRVARTSGDAEFRTRAETALRGIAADATAHGPLAAHYVMAMRELSRE
jgi:uncharacterized protein YyaL (SSP411 family)